MEVCVGEDAREMLRGYLAERDEECPGCGYNLRDLTGTRCPECNQELVLRVGLAEPRMAWFVAGTVGISMGLGFCLMLTIWAGVSLVWQSSRGGGPQFGQIVPLAAGSVVGGLLMWWWVRARRRLSGATAERRWCWVAGMTLAALMCPVWFFVIVR